MSNKKGAAKEEVLTPSEVEYWEHFYDTGEGRTTYEWYAQYPSIRTLILPYLFTNCRVLHIGCGNSLLAEQLIEDEECPEGVTIASIDINETAIESMNEREEARRAVLNTNDSQQGSSSKGRKSKKTGNKKTSTNSSATATATPKLTYEVMDVLHTRYEDGEFDVVIDKGMLDALISTGQEETGENEEVKQLIREMMRVIKKPPTPEEAQKGSRGGVYLIVSRNASFLLDSYFFELNTTSEVHHFSSSAESSLFFYIVKPLPDGDVHSDDDEA